MAQNKKNYEFQKGNLKAYYKSKELSSDDLIDLIIEARKQRDEFQTQRDNFKKGNQAIAERILKIGKHLDNADKLCKLH